jgi:Matrixin
VGSRGRIVLVVMCTLLIGTLSSPIAVIAQTDDPLSNRVGDVQPERRPDCPVEKAMYKASELPERVHRSCDMTGKVVLDHGAGATVPPPGQLVAAEGLEADGGAQDFVISTLEDGTVIFDDEGSESPEGDGSTEGNGGSGDDWAGGAECNEDGYKHKGWVITWEPNGKAWSWDRDTVPDYMGDRDQVWHAINEGGNNIEEVNDDCGFPDVVDRPLFGFWKDQDVGTNICGTCIKENVHCTENDFVSMVNFAQLNGFIAYACTWSNGAEVSKIDTRYDDDGTRWFALEHVPDQCTDKYDLEGVATHESGHHAGLGHVGDDNSHLTMHQGSSPCTRPRRTLGLGDKNGLRALYSH